MKRSYKEIKQPKPDIEYWMVYNHEDELVHYFKTRREANEYAFDNFIEEENIMKECFN